MKSLMVALHDYYQMGVNLSGGQFKFEELCARWSHN